MNMYNKVADLNHLFERTLDHNVRSQRDKMAGLYKYDDMYDSTVDRDTSNSVREMLTKGIVKHIQSKGRSNETF